MVWVAGKAACHQMYYEEGTAATSSCSRIVPQVNPVACASIKWDQWIALSQLEEHEQDAALCQPEAVSCTGDTINAMPCMHALHKKC
jgi:hypothetical protein